MTKPEDNIRHICSLWCYVTVITDSWMEQNLHAWRTNAPIKPATMRSCTTV